ncbi:hypothetical protein JTB14_011945 [Gonioctena quinquepunctata]|nr:hypothetical protein JTB14_011945 [Gonioctena quinquepunctata]
MMIENLNISFPDIYPDNADHPPPWPVKVPSCNRSLTIYDKSNTNPNVIKNALNNILTPNHIASEKIFTYASKSRSGMRSSIVTYKTIQTLPSQQYTYGRVICNTPSTQICK